MVDRLCITIMEKITTNIQVDIVKEIMIRRCFKLEVQCTNPFSLSDIKNLVAVSSMYIFLHIQNIDYSSLIVVRRRLCLKHAHILNKSVEFKSERILWKLIIYGQILH